MCADSSFSYLLGVVLFAYGYFHFKKNFHANLHPLGMSVLMHFCTHSYSTVPICRHWLCSIFFTWQTNLIDFDSFLSPGSLDAACLSNSFFGGFICAWIFRSTVFTSTTHIMVSMMVV